MMAFKLVNITEEQLDKIKQSAPSEAKEGLSYPDSSSPTFHFKRREMKYVIHNDSPVTDIISLIHTYFPLAPYKPDIFPTKIQTTWCESPDWLSLREYLNRKELRSKLRVRRYGDLEKFTDKCFVEIKSKTEYGKLSSKYRFMCPLHLIQDLMDGKDIRNQIVGLNAEVEGFDKLYIHVRKMIIELGFRPLLRGEYSRAYFQHSRSDPLRLTLDGFAKFTYLPDKRSFTEKFRVLETKTRQGADLDLLDDVLGAVGAERVWRFSKFHRAMKLFEPDLLERINSML